MKKRILAAAASVCILCSLAGCAQNDQNGGLKNSDQIHSDQIHSDSIKNNEEQETGTAVTLKFWCDENELPVFQHRIGQFLEDNRAEADIKVICEPVGASICKDTFLDDLDNGADVFCLPDDQILSMAASGVLEEVPDAEEVYGRSLEGAAEAASVDGRLYAYPLTADNGYFLYYDKRYFKEGDVKTLDRILDICASHGKKFVMSWTSGWYLYSFFGNTGLEMGVNEDGLTNFCEWNETEGDLTGTDIAQALLDIAGHPGFLDADDAQRVEMLEDGTAIAAVSGIWDAAIAEEAFGGEYGACKLPTYTCAGRQIQMSSFTGYRFLGVNSYSAHKEWADRLADYLSAEESQQYFFEQLQHGPANSNAAASDAVGKVPAIAAVQEQAEYGVLQRIGQKFWTPVMTFGTTMAAGNPNHIPLQDLMDQLVSGITES